MKLGLNDALIAALTQSQRGQPIPPRENAAQDDPRQRPAAKQSARAQQIAATDRLAELPAETALRPSPDAPARAGEGNSRQGPSGAAELRLSGDIPRGSYLDILV